MFCIGHFSLHSQSSKKLRLHETVKSNMECEGKIMQTIIENYNQHNDDLRDLTGLPSPSTVRDSNYSSK